MKEFSYINTDKSTHGCDKEVHVVRYTVNKEDHIYDLSDLSKHEKISDNDCYKSYSVQLNVPATLYVKYNSIDSDINEKINPKPHYQIETWEDYQNILEGLDETNTAWLDKIIEGISEMEKVEFRTEEFIVIRDWKYQPNNSGKYNPKNLHLLGVPIRRIPSIRDIKVSDLDLLDQIVKKSCEICHSVYGVPESEIKVYLHYVPSVYHLHIHFVWIGYYESSIGFERAYSYDMIIKAIF